MVTTVFNNQEAAGIYIILITKQITHKTLLESFGLSFICQIVGF